MKTQKYQKRFYRGWVSAPGLRGTRVRERETDLHILTDTPLDGEFVRRRVRHYRSQIETYINEKEPLFLTSLKPIPVERDAPPIVRRMAAQAKKAGVGPMAAVAGAIAQFLGNDLLKAGCADVIVENGGDIFLKVRRSARAALYAGRSRFSKRLSILVDPAKTPLGICTSSGTVGHSLSFGKADSVTVIAKDALLADACATAVGNRVGTAADLAAAVEFARGIPGVRGVLIIVGSTLASWGDITLG